MPRNFPIIVLLPAVLVSWGFSQPDVVPVKSGAEALLRVEAGAAAVEDYVVDLEAEVSMERLRAPRMKATLFFKKPDRVHVESPGFALLPREGLVVNAPLLRTNYDAEVVGYDSVGDARALKLQLTAREASVRLRQLNVWIDPSNWTIVRFETVPYQGRLLRATLRYELQQGKYWLPVSSRVTFETVSRDTLSPGPELDVPGVAKWEEQRRPPRSGQVTVEFSNYRINSGLDDAIFMRKE